MGVTINLDDLRWAEEPVGPDTLARFTPVPDKAKREMRAGVYASLWQLKGK